MTDYTSEFTFKLSKPASYHKNIGGGKFEDGTFDEIILKAPSNNQEREISLLEQGFFRAAAGLQEGREEVEEKKGEDIKLTGSQITGIIMSSKVDFYGYLDTFRKILTNGGAFVEQQNLTQPMWKEIDYQDKKRMLGEYISNFLSSSWMEILDEE